ncbi:DUF262 domain-containing protein [Streptomyces sp. NPDC057580]|uniref:DUF262 domain-containing protein n=1 Tax=Streptomyces sp. NPDC057580 TaxID=3346173 RepID=UPI0036C5B209
MTSNAAFFRASSFSSRSTWRRSLSFSASAADFFGRSQLVRTVERSEQAGQTGEMVAQHFLGAVVFDETPYLSSNLETRQVIDGQQRLTTLQLFLFAARLSAKALNHERSVRLLSKFLENDEDLFDSAQHPDHLYKAWPTNSDRDEYRSVMLGQGGPGHLAEAVSYFRQEVDAWLAEAPAPHERVGVLVQGAAVPGHHRSGGT